MKTLEDWKPVVNFPFQALLITKISLLVTHKRLKNKFNFQLVTDINKETFICLLHFICFVKSIELIQRKVRHDAQLTVIAAYMSPSNCMLLMETFRISDILNKEHKQITLARYAIRT